MYVHVLGKWRLQPTLLRSLIIHVYTKGAACCGWTSQVAAWILLQYASESFPKVSRDHGSLVLIHLEPPLQADYAEQTHRMEK
jgi:hypothetical protein